MRIEPAATEKLDVAQPSKLIAVVDSVETDLNDPILGERYTASSVDRTLVKYRLRDANIFRKVVDRKPAHGDYVQLRFRFERTTEFDQGSIVGGALFIVFTLGLATPLLNFEKELSKVGRLDAIRSDGKTFSSVREVNGHAEFKLFGELAANAEFAKADDRLLSLLLSDLAASPLVLEHSDDRRSLP